MLFFKQKTAYEMRISDWSSDVCSSDPAHRRRGGSCRRRRPRAPEGRTSFQPVSSSSVAASRDRRCRECGDKEDRKSVVEGKRVSVRVDLDGRRIMQKQRTSTQRVTQHNRRQDKGRETI